MSHRVKSPMDVPIAIPYMFYIDPTTNSIIVPTNTTNTLPTNTIVPQFNQITPESMNPEQMKLFECTDCCVGCGPSNSGCDQKCGMAVPGCDCGRKVQTSAKGGGLSTMWRIIIAQLIVFTFVGIYMYLMWSKKKKMGTPWK